MQTGIGPDRTVLGGFSMGCVMSYALGLDGARPAPAGILALSGFIPTVEGWEPSLGDRSGTAVLIAHGRLDPVIPVRSRAPHTRCSNRPASTSTTASSTGPTRSIRTTCRARPPGSRRRSAPGSRDERAQTPASPDPIQSPGPLVPRGAKK